MRMGFSQWLATLTILASQTACLRPAPVNVYRMGEKVQAGQLIYNVFETKWQAQIGEGQQARRPANRFMIMHLTIVNSGAEPVSAPSFKLTDESGRTYTESMEGQGVPLWLGMIRKVKPADTLEGNAVFDVEPKSYKLKLDDGSESGSVVIVELPLQFDTNRPSLNILEPPAKILETPK
jgi:Domain of unknown function (DUF4352)